MKKPGTRFTLEVTPTLPPRLARLADLADDLWYAWDRPTRDLFARLDLDLWRSVGHSPKALLRQVDEQRLTAAAEDQVYLTNYSRVLSAYDTYLGQTARRTNGDGLAADDVVAYFCAEFGFHESLPIYSGGLGILAGDHCKAASDARLPFVGVGLLYRQGYFFQTIDEGNQNATYHDSDFEALPDPPRARCAGTRRCWSPSICRAATSRSRCGARVGHVLAAAPRHRRGAQQRGRPRHRPPPLRRRPAHAHRAGDRAGRGGRTRPRPAGLMHPPCGTSTRATPPSSCSSAPAG